MTQQRLVPGAGALVSIGTRQRALPGSGMAAPPPAGGPTFNPAWAAGRNVVINPAAGAPA